MSLAAGDIDSDERFESDERLESAAQRILSDQLPIPVRRRWQPLRAGLMNLFLFEDERFPFADGRLLLRGTNGTGKSRVLAMTLPLLLDGSFKATRVEPDRDSNRQVVWNLLMDDQNSATGYSWLEFGRIDDEGNDLFVTIGCGMRATRGQSIKPWFFVTSQRVDESLQLKTVDNVPLTQQKLEELIGDAGQMFKSKNEYRRAVDERLFRLGERYDPLIDLLLQLRQPKLAEKLDIEQLETALREALPPLPESLLDDAAEAFRDLDQYRSSLALDRETLRNIQRFLKPYRDHVQRGVKRSLKTLTTANSRYESAQRELKTLEEQIAAETKRREELVQGRRELQVQIDAGQAAINELTQSPEMRTAQRLDEQQAAVVKLSEQFEVDKTSAENAGEELDTARQQTAEIEGKAAAIFQTMSEESDNCRSLAAPESLQNTHLQQMQPVLASGWIESREPFDAAKKQLLRESNRFQKSAEHLLQRNTQLAEMDRELKSLQAQVQQAEHQRDEAAANLESANAAKENARSELWDAILQWHESAKPLLEKIENIETWHELWHQWNAESHHDDPSARIVESARSAKISELIACEQRLIQQQEQLAPKQSALQDERSRIEAGEPIQPPARSHRSQPTTTKQPTSDKSPGLSADPIDLLGGVPFWQLVDFKPEIPEHERGNWEAALHDAGILDAVLLPNGRLVGEPDDGAQPIQLSPADTAPLEKHRQLAQILKADADSPHPHLNQLLNQILPVIGVGHNAGSTWVAGDGRWRNGPVRGRLTKPQPQYIGKEVRDRWRQIRLAEINDQIQELERRQQEIETAIETIQQQRDEIENLVAAFPDSQTVLKATQSATAAQTGFDRSAHQLATVQENEAALQTKVESATKQRDEDAADFGLSAWATRAEELRSRLGSYITRLETLDARVDAAVSVSHEAQRGKRTLVQAEERLTVARDRLTKSQSDLEQTREKVRVLQESAGKGVAELMQRLETARQDQKERMKRKDSLTEKESDAKTRIAVSGSKLEERRAESATSDEERRLATDWFADLHTHQLIEFAVPNIEIPELPWSMTAAIRLARLADSMLTNVSHDDETWLSSQSRLLKSQNELQQTVLSQDAMGVEVEPLRDGLQMVRLTVQGERFAPPAAAARLEEEIATRERILDEKEQDTLEKYLLGEVAEGLRKGMRMASDLVRVMTSEVSERPMKTGMQMRFKWRRDDDGPAGLAEACEVLATDAATWSPNEREQIKRFLQRSIRQQRELEPTGSWREHMRAALDYRRWHRIAIERRSGPDANWLKLTRRTYAGGSGGEKAIALTLPPLAAAAAYYQSADKLAPRFILLDEAFAGIDSGGRESCMELITAFGLDVVMTSESEWGMYAGVKQLAICQLDRFSDINAVVNRVYVWNGLQKREMISRSEAAERASQPLFSSDVGD